MVLFKFKAIPEGVPYEQKDVEHEIELDTPEEVVRFLNLQAAHAKVADNDMGALVFSTVAERIAAGNRYGHHLVSIGDYVPQIVEWSLQETAPERYASHGRVRSVN